MKNTGVNKMNNKALVVIDIQNDITKNYRDIIENVNNATVWAEKSGIYIIYVKHNDLSEKSKMFKNGTRGAEFVKELKILSTNIFTKTKSNALTSNEFVNFIDDREISEFFIVGADATACIKSTCYNMAKAGYSVTVLSDCITCYDKKKLPEMLNYYKSKGCFVKTLREIIKQTII